MRSTVKWQDLQARKKGLPFLRRRCAKCQNDVRAQQLHAALERVYREPDHTVPDRWVSFSCVHDGNAFSDLGVLGVVAKAHKMCKKDGETH